METQGYLKPTARAVRGYTAPSGMASSKASCCCRPARRAARSATIRGRFVPTATRMEHRWIEAKGTGTVYSWTISHHAFHPGFKPELPYILLTVDLAEGVRMQAQARGMAAMI